MGMGVVVIWKVAAEVKTALESVTLPALVMLLPFHLDNLP